MTRTAFVSALLVMFALSACGTAPDMHPVVDLIPRTWKGYTRRFVDADGRVFRPRNDRDTVSEGQAYALLIASLLDDRPTFDRVLDWTERHLSRERRTGDHLLAWHWEPGKGVTDWNSASDADLDYALALLVAHRRWQDARYAEKARPVLSDVLDLETEVVHGRRYLLPGTWRRPGDAYLINPSYLSPAHFRVFFTCTGDPRWSALIDGGYDLLAAVSRRFDGRSGVGLVPDWVLVTPDGEFAAATGFSDRFGWDAIRVPWRVGLDDVLFGEARAQRYLRDFLEFYTREWQQHGGRFFAEYTYEGDAVARYEAAAAYAMSLGPLAHSRSPLLAAALGKLEQAFNPVEEVFEARDDYYENSLVLLGLILYREATRPAAFLRGLRCG